MIILKKLCSVIILFVFINIFFCCGNNKQKIIEENDSGVAAYLEDSDFVLYVEKLDATFMHVVETMGNLADQVVANREEIEKLKARIEELEKKK